MQEALSPSPRRALAGEFMFFGAIGLVSTGLHIGVVMGLVESGLAGPVPANIAAFFLANSFSFVANCLINFRLSVTRQRYLSFLAVSGAGLSLSAFLAGLAQYLHWHYLGGLTLVVLLTPALSFLLQRRFTFRQALSSLPPGPPYGDTDQTGQA